MNEETMDTMIILNNIAVFVQGNDWILKTKNSTVVVRRHDNVFYTKPLYTPGAGDKAFGFEFIEILAEKYPAIAKKLAEPMR